MQKYLKYKVQNTIISKLATRTYDRFQNYFYYANQIITILTTENSESTVSNYIFNLEPTNFVR